MGFGTTTHPSAFGARRTRDGVTHLNEENVDGPSIDSGADVLETQHRRPTGRRSIEELGNKLPFVLRLPFLRDLGGECEDDRRRHRAGIDSEAAGQDAGHIRWERFLDSGNMRIGAANDQQIEASVRAPQLREPRTDVPVVLRCDFV